MKEGFALLDALFFFVERLHMILRQPVDRRGSVLRVEARCSVGGL